VLLALAACLLAGTLAGLLNGWIVVKIGIPSLVATIGTSFFWRAWCWSLRTYRHIAGADSTDVPLSAARGSHRIFRCKWWDGCRSDYRVVLLESPQIRRAPVPDGDNIDSSRLMGINVDRTKMIAFATVGLAAAFAGLVVSAELLYFWPTWAKGIC